MATVVYRPDRCRALSMACDRLFRAPSLAQVCKSEYSTRSYCFSPDTPGADHSILKHSCPVRVPPPPQKKPPNPPSAKPHWQLLVTLV